MKHHSAWRWTLLLTVTAACSSHAGTTKDIVIDRLTAPVVEQAAPAVQATPLAAARSDVMAVSVLLESPDGTLQPKPVNAVFATGDRFRVKLLSARPGKVSLYNTTPAGQFRPEAIWQGVVKPGQETVSPRLRLEGLSGVDQLHVVLEPVQPAQGIVAWIARWLQKDASADASKDIRLDSENTDTATYLVNQAGEGVVTTIRIVHR